MSRRFSWRSDSTSRLEDLVRELKDREQKLADPNASDNAKRVYTESLKRIKESIVAVVRNVHK